MWQNLVHLSINRSKWTEDEGKSLTKLVREEVHHNRTVDWDRVAKKLGTNRTACQVIMK